MLPDTILHAPLSVRHPQGDFRINMFSMGFTLMSIMTGKLNIDTSSIKMEYKSHPKKDYQYLLVSPFSLANVKEQGLAYPRDYNVIFDETHSPADTSTALH